jgi:uncharacterized protein (DUF427 family)
VIRLLIAASLAVDATCHPTLSAGADITAVVVYVVFRSLRMRLARRESDDRLVVEGNHYFRLEDVNMEFPDESPTHTVCSWKGEASCYTVLVDEKRNAEAAWYYPHPSPAASRVCRQGRVLAGREVEPLGRWAGEAGGWRKPSVEAPEPIAAGPSQVACLRVLRLGHPLPPLSPHQGRSST